MIACTSFSPQGYEQYGRKFLQTFVRYWPIPIHVFHEGQKPEIESEKIVYRDLSRDRALGAFLGDWGAFRISNGIFGNKAIYRYQAVKFAKKVYALTSERPECDWWIWIDADVETYRRIDDEFLSSVCRPEFTASYLGRKDWNHSECGFVAYNIGNGGHDFLRTFRETYDSGALFRMPEWHDSFVFDAIRAAFEMRGRKFLNLSEGIGGLHVWPHTVLGRYMIHSKGPEVK